MAAPVADCRRVWFAHDDGVRGTLAATDRRTGPGRRRGATGAARGKGDMPVDGDVTRRSSAQEPAGVGAPGTAHTRRRGTGEAGDRHATPTQTPAHRDVVLDADVRVLLRPGPSVQFGADPDGALVFRLPDAARPGAVLRALLASGRTASPGLPTDLTAAGIPGATADALLEELVRAGLATRGGRRPAHPTVTVIGRDVLRRHLTEELRARGVAASGRAPGSRTTAWLDAAPPEEIGAVAVTGMEVPDHGLLGILRRRGLPHLCARVRDGRAVIGPWWQPGPGGLPSPGPCPACGEAESLAADPARRVLALQLSSPQAAADPSAVAAAATAAAAQLVRGPSPAVAGAEVVLDPHGLSVRRRVLSPRVDCPVCRGGPRARVAQSAP